MPATGLVLAYRTNLTDRPLAPATVNRRLAALRSLVKLGRTFDVGLRCAEVVGLDVTDVDLEQGTAAVLGKGRSDKVRLTLPEPTQQALRAWLAIRGTEPGPLFRNVDRAKKGERLTATGLYRMVRTLGGRLGLTVRPHGLRHAAITAALDLTGDLRAVQRFSRHRDVRVLTLYDDNRADLGAMWLGASRPRSRCPVFGTGTGGITLGGVRPGVRHLPPSRERILPQPAGVSGYSVAFAPLRAPKTAYWDTSARCILELNRCGGPT